MKNNLLNNKGILIVKGLIYDERIETLHGIDYTLVCGDMIIAKKILDEYHATILYEQLLCINSFLNLSDITTFPARIEYGAIIRENVKIKDNAVVLMGAVLNKGVMIGERTMVDMNAVIGSGAIIGNDVHIGAGAVIAGVMEPESNKPVIIEDGVFIGANAVILEGVKVGKYAVIGAGSVVLHDVDENTMMIKSPAEKLRDCTEIDRRKLGINLSLRKGKEVQ